MSSNRAEREIYIDTESTALKAYRDGNLFDPDTQYIHRGTQALFKAHLLMSDGETTFNPPTGCTWLFGMDSVYTLDHPDLVLSQDDQFCLAGDWSGMDEATGKICWRVDLTSDALKTAIGANATLVTHAYLWMCPTSGSYTLIGYWDITVKNIAVDPTTATPVQGISHVTIDLLNATIASLTTPTSGLYRIQNGAIQLKNSTQGNFQTISMSGAAGEETMDYGPGES